MSSAGALGNELERSLHDLDPTIAGLIDAELARQRRSLDLVASESIAPLAVLEAQGSILTNKYAVGYPGRRNYDGCEVVDEIESIAIERARTLFGAEYANVQPYSGSNANAAVLQALCAPGDAILGFDFDHGGHPTQHDAATSAGRFYRAFAYHCRRDDRLVDMDEVAALAREHRPKVIFAGWSSYPRYLDFPAFRAIADEVGAYLVVDMAHFAGLVAAGLHPDPVPFADLCTFTTHKTLGGPRGGAIVGLAALGEAIDAAVFPGTQGCPLMHVIAAKAVSFHIAAGEAHAEAMARTLRGARLVAAALGPADLAGVRVITGGTDVHQVLLDVSDAGLDGEGALRRLNGAGMNANAIRIAFDARSAPACSGVRLGTAALAGRGFADAEFAEVGEILVAALTTSSAADAGSLAARTHRLAAAFPLYPGLA